MGPFYRAIATPRIPATPARPTATPPVAAAAPAAEVSVEAVEEAVTELEDESVIVVCEAPEEELAPELESVEVVVSVWVDVAEARRLEMSEGATELPAADRLEISAWASEVKKSLTLVGSELAQSG